MKKEEKMRFKPLNKNSFSFDCPTGYWWVGHPDCAGPEEEEKLLIENRDKLWFIDGVSDPDPSYDYNEYALVKLGRTYYMCHTSGCSCPRPSETWVVLASGSKKDVISFTLAQSWTADWAIDYWKERL